MSTKTKTKIPLALSKEFEENWKNPMKKPYLEKLVLNIGVGVGGQELEKAATVLETIAGQKAIKTLSKTNVKEFNLRKGRPIGTKITIRGQNAEKLLKKLLIVNSNKILRRSFDNYGNFGFGIKEHISIPGIEYESTLGIWGLDVCGRIIRPGIRVKYRRKSRAKVPKYHYVSREEAQFFLEKNFGVNVVKVLDLEYI
ncbi:MAG: 50S ribosomal protein L5 [Candidatus Lokiarchaeota archaeon]|nr:50S ribosomal protein L5 [Candidatus Lokiarchaeota archaeon]